MKSVKKHENYNANRLPEGQNGTHKNQAWRAGIWLMVSPIQKKKREREKPKRFECENISGSGKKGTTKNPYCREGVVIGKRGFPRKHLTGEKNHDTKNKRE